jgi:hypothetical protein
MAAPYSAAVAGHPVVDGGAGSTMDTATCSAYARLRTAHRGIQARDRKERTMTTVFVARLIADTLPREAARP